VLSFHGREIVVLKQLLGEMRLDNGRTVLEGLSDLRELPSVKNFVPREGQIRLGREAFDLFAEKIKVICDA
jgi:hypothetical protein